MRSLSIAAMFFFTIGCTKSPQFHSTPRNPAINSTAKGDIIINEFSVRAEDTNEFGEASDWIELYNSTNKEITLKEGEWIITDNIDKADKYFLPEIIIPAKGHYIIWCDGEDKVKDQVHTNFKLSSKGESIGLFYNEELMDSFTYFEADEEKKSFGRRAVGSDAWHSKEESTPGSANK